MAAASSSDETPLTIQQALSIAISAYTAKHQKSKAIFERSLNHLPGANTRSVLYSSPFPLAFDRADGVTLHSADGRQYADFLGEFTAGILGHRHPEIQLEIEAAAKDGWSFGGVNVWEGKLAGKVCERWNLESVRFTNSGTEANLMALGVAKAFTGKKKIIVFENGYHGSVLSFKQPISPLNVLHDFLILPYNDETALKAAVSDLPPSSLAAILVEPMQGSGGCIVASPSFLTLLRNTCTQQSALLILDEVMTSRMQFGGMQSTYGVKPDLTTLGKYVGGGFSFGAFGGRGDVMSLFDPRREGDGLPHSGTFNNNTFSMRAGLKALEILTEDVLEDLATTGRDMHGLLNELFDKAGVKNRCEVTGHGSLLNMHFYVKGKEAEKEEDRDVMDLFWFYMIERGVYLARRGFIALTILHDSGMVTDFVARVSEFILKYRDFLQ